MEVVIAGLIIYSLYNNQSGGNSRLEEIQNRADIRMAELRRRTPDITDISPQAILLREQLEVEVLRIFQDYLQDIEPIVEENPELRQQQVEIQNNIRLLEERIEQRAQEQETRQQQVETQQRIQQEMEQRREEREEIEDTDVPEFAEDCRNERDYITQMDWDDDDEEDLIKIDWDTGKWECYTRSSIRHWMNNDDVKAIEWIKNEDASQQTSMGYGYKPKQGSDKYIKMWPLDNYILLDDLQQMVKSRTKNFKLNKLPPIRLGNLRGSFGVSELHGQEPFPPRFTWADAWRKWDSDEEDVNVVLNANYFDENADTNVYNEVLIQLIQNNDVSGLSRAIRNPNYDVNYDEDVFTPLEIAINNNFIDIVRLLLEHPNIDVNMGSIGETTPLMQASMKDRLKIVELLLEHPNINVHATDNTFDRNMTALDYARQENASQSLIELLENAM